jgi:hypothetical protein
VNGETEGFTAAEVTDGTLEDFAKTGEVIFDSDFSAGTDRVLQNSGSGTTEITGNNDGISDGTTSKDDVLKVENIQRITPQIRIADAPENTYRGSNKGSVTFTYYVPAGSAIIGKYWQIGSFRGSAGILSSSGVQIVGGAWTTASLSYDNKKPLSTFLTVTNQEVTDTESATFADADAGDVYYISKIKAYSYEELGLPLDQATGAAAAYSLRNLSSSYTGNVVEVRRSSDDAVQAFTASEVADGTLTDWVNVGNDYVGYARFQDASTANVNLSSSFTLEASKSWSIKFECIVGELPAGLFGKSDFSNGGFWFANPNTIGLTDDSDSYQALSFGTGLALNLGQNYELEFFNTPSEGVRVAVDGTTMSTAPKVYGDITINKIGVSRGRAGERVIHNVRVDLNGDGTLDYSYAGDGNQASNWVDRVGSNNGTPAAQVLAYDNEYTDGHVKTWYDQSGSDNHAVQTDTAKQPKIVEGGSLLEDGIDFDGTSHFFDIDFGSNLSQPNSFFLSHTSDTTNSGLNEYFDTASGSPRTLLDVGAGYRLLAGIDFDSGFAMETNRVLISAFANSTSSFLFKNGVSSVVGDAGTDSINQYSYLGRSFDRYYDGKMDEFIIYNSDQSTKRRAIEENIANHYDISLAAFSRDGTVKTWYDQSGNTNDAVQTDPTKQPKIVVNGSLVQKRNKPSIKFADDSSDERYLTSPADIGSSFSFFASWQPLADDVTAGSNAAQKRNSTLLYGSGSLYIAGINSDFTNGYKSGAGTDSYSAGIDFQKSLNLHTIIEGSADINYFGNGTNEIDGSGDASTVTTTQYYIGSKVVVPTHNTRGYISELIHYNTDQTDNRTALEANIGETYGITEIPAANDTVNGFVQTWYDQSGEARNGEQDTAAYQPKIVVSGVLQKDTDGNPYVKFEGSQYLRVYKNGSLSEGLILPDVQNTFSVSVSSSTTPINKFICQANRSSDRYYLYNNRLTVGDNQSIIDSPTVNTKNVRSVTATAAGSFSLYLNSSLAGTVSYTGSVTGGDSTIGASFSGSSGHEGSIYELVFYRTDLSSKRELLETNVANQYGITLS